MDDNKRFDYLRPQNYFYLSRRLSAENLRDTEISVRYNSSLSGTKFREQFKTDMANSLQIGNFYLLSIIPYSKIGQDTTKRFGIDNDIKLRVYLMIFLLLCIFLCMMGVFWYRISLCRNETGLRKALGATRRDIRANLIIEGIWLLLLVTLPAMLIEYQFVYAELIETVGRSGTPDPATYLPDRTFVRFLITNAVTFLFLGIVITSAIWIPAQKGALLAPAEALYYE
jgi:putative ABC transport system permease protein